MCRSKTLTFRLAAASALFSAGLAAQRGSFATTTPGSAGTNGAVPVLTAYGDLIAGFDGSELEVSDALPGAAAVLVVGFSELVSPLFGITLGPAPDLVVTNLAIDGSGKLVYPLTIPGGTPAGTEFWTQTLILDAGSPGGVFAATNTLQITSGAFEFFPNYQNPNPSEFHPLRQGNTSLLAFDEVLTLFNNGSTRDPNDTSVGSLFSRDDVGVGSGTIRSESASVSDFIAVESGAGDIDGDGDQDAVFIGRRNGVTHIRAISPDGNGGYDLSNAITSRFLQPFPGVNVTSSGVHGDVGDVDGDGIDEVVTLATQRVNGQPFGTVLKVWSTGSSPSRLDVIRAVRFLDSDFGRVELGQFDDDDAMEIVIAVGLDPSAGRVEVRVLDDASADFQLLSSEFINLVNPTGLGTLHSAELAVGNYDPDPEEEFSIVMQIDFGPAVRLPDARHTAYQFRHFIDALDLSDTTSFRSTDPLTSGPFRDAGDLLWQRKPTTRRDQVVAARLGNQQFDYVFMMNQRRLDSGWQLGVVGYDPLNPSAGNGTGGSLPSTQTRRAGEADLVAMDDRGEGEDRILICLSGHGRSWLSPEAAEFWLLQSDDNSFGNTTLTRVGRAPGNAIADRAPLLVAGDFDREGVRLRYTGTVVPAVANPVPLVLLAAPPTDDRATKQNRDFTGSSYTQLRGTAFSHTVTNSSSMSFSVGVGVGDLFGAFDLSARKATNREWERTTIETQTVTQFASWDGAWDADSILFQGTLYLSYHYEAIGGRNPSVADGSIVTINVPIEWDLFQVELDTYNAFVDPSQRIGSDVLTHTIGDPSTYKSEDDVLALSTNSNVSSFYMTDDTQVAQTGGFNSQGITIGQVLGTGDALTYSIEESANFGLSIPTQYGAGVLSLGLTRAFGQETLYEVSVENTTEFKGTVGSIPDRQQWLDYLYSWGMFTYVRGGPNPYQVLDYWTENSRGGV